MWYSVVDLNQPLSDYKSPSLTFDLTECVAAQIGFEPMGLATQKFSRLRPYDHLGTAPYGRDSRIRTYAWRSQSPLPYRLAISLYNGTPSENRTHDTTVKGWGLNHLSMGAFGGRGGSRTLKTTLLRRVCMPIPSLAQLMWSVPPSSVFPLCQKRSQQCKQKSSQAHHRCPPTPVGTPDGIRTHTVRILSPFPLPIGIRERVFVCIS